MQHRIETDGLIDDEITGPDTAPIWGFERPDKAVHDTLSTNDGIVFSNKPGVYTHYLPVAATIENSNAMSELWVEYEDGTKSGGITSPRPYLVIGSDIQRITVPKDELEDAFAAVPEDGSTRLITGDAIEPFHNKYGTFEAFLRDRDQTDDHDTNHVEQLDDSSTIPEIVAALQQVVPDDLSDIATEQALESIDRSKRKAAFRDGIYELYDGCAVCQTPFQAPDGSHNLEAAHILPKNQGGPDVLQNGIALCSRHHWAFDHGWFSITTDLRIHVPDRPDLDGYEAFTAYDGTSLHLPETESLHPHQTYIQQRNSTE